MDTKSRREFLKLTAMGTALGFSPLALRATAQDIDMNKEKFLDACSRGDLSAIRKFLIADNKLLFARDAQGRSGFTLAKLSGHHSVGQFLKESGYLTDLHESALDLNWDRFEKLIGEESVETASRVNADHPIGGCVMWGAAAGGAGPNIWRVYAQCGDPNCLPRDSEGTTPLQIALRFPDLKVAELTSATLLSNDANPNPQRTADLPPLHIAAERGSFEMVEMLIRLGADIDRKDNNGMLAAQLAERSGQQRVWQLLQNHQQVQRTCRTSRTAYDAFGKKYSSPEISDIPLYMRRRLVGQAHRNLEYIQKEVTANPRMAHCVATTSEICVEACAHTGRKPIVDYLLENGAPYSLPTAVLLGDHTTAKRMLDEDSNRIHERGAHDFALLWYPVIGRCELGMTQLLLDRGAKVEEQHFLGTTALHWASIHGPIELVELLVENGADVNRAGRKFGGKSETPLQKARDAKIADYLRSKGAE